MLSSENDLKGKAHAYETAGTAACMEESVSQQEDLGSTNDESPAVDAAACNRVSTEAEEARHCLPLGLAWAGNCASIAAARNRVSAACMQGIHDGRRGNKRIRSMHEQLKGTVPF